MELIDRIKRVNKERERINKESVEAQARKNVLEEQISELVEAYSQKYNISFPTISNLEEFGNFLEDLLDKTAAALENEVELAEEVNQLISEGHFEEAKEVLTRQGVAIPEVPEEVTSEEGSELEEQNEEDGNEEVIDEDDEVSESLEELEEGLKEDLAQKPKRPIRNVEPVEEEDEEEEEVPQERPKLRRSRRRVPQTSDFDMSISKEDLDEVAAVTPKKTQPLEELDDLDSESNEAEEEAPKVSKLIRRRPRVSNDESSASPVRRRRSSGSGLISPDDLEDEDMPVGNPAPVKSGGSFSWDN